MQPFQDSRIIYAVNLDQEAHIITQAKADIAAFAPLFDAYYPHIYRYLVKRTGSVEIAEDLTSITFMKAIENLHKFTPHKTILAWLYKIAGNELKQHYRKSNRESVVDDETLSSLAEVSGAINDETNVLQDRLDIDAAHKMVMQHLGELPAKYQEVITLRFSQGLSIQEVADITGRRPGTVKSISSRGIKMLQSKCNQTADQALYRVGGPDKGAKRKEQYEAQ